MSWLCLTVRRLVQEKSHVTPHDKPRNADGCTYSTPTGFLHYTVYYPQLTYYLQLIRNEIATFAHLLKSKKPTLRTR